MAYYLRLYVIGEPCGGYEPDDLQTIRLQILVGVGGLDENRWWLESHSCDPDIKPIGKLRIILEEPDHADALLDASIAFLPEHFRRCPSLAKIESALGDTEKLDFLDGPVPSDWATLREEARPMFGELHIWQADFVPMRRKVAMGSIARDNPAAACWSVPGSHRRPE